MIARLDGGDVGVLATSITEGTGWIDQLYLAPGDVGQSIGVELLKHLLNLLPRPTCLWTFQENDRAIRFDEHHGFKALGYTRLYGNIRVEKITKRTALTYFTKTNNDHLNSGGDKCLGLPMLLVHSRCLKQCRTDICE